jgi:hypothetical protein
VENVRPGFTDVPSHLLQHSNVVIGVEKYIFLGTIGTATGYLVGFQACLREDNDQTFRVVVFCRERRRLFGSEGGKRRERLSPRTLSNRRSGGHCKNAKGRTIAGRRLM